MRGRKCQKPLLNISGRNKQEEKDLLRSVPTLKANSLAPAERKVGKKKIKNDNIVSNLRGHCLGVIGTNQAQKYLRKTRLEWKTGPELSVRHVLFGVPVDKVKSSYFMRFKFVLFCSELVGDFPFLSISFPLLLLLLSFRLPLFFLSPSSNHPPPSSFFSFLTLPHSHFLLLLPHLPPFTSPLCLSTGFLLISMLCNVCVCDCKLLHVGLFLHIQLMFDSD